MQAVNQLTFVIRLDRVNKVEASGGCRGCNRRLDLGKGGGAVGLWLALTEQVQVRATQHEESIASGMCADSCAHCRKFNAL
jgi:hypothetical protein